MKSSKNCGPYFNGLKRKWGAPNGSSFVGGSLALLLLYRRIKDSCARHKSKMGWPDIRRCILGVTCNKPMRVPSPIPFKSHERIWIWRVYILTARLQSPMRQMHDHMNFKPEMAQFIAKSYCLIHTWNTVFFHNFRNTESSNKFQQRNLKVPWHAILWML